MQAGDCCDCLQRPLALNGAGWWLAVQAAFQHINTRSWTGGAQLHMHVLYGKWHVAEQCRVGLCSQASMSLYGGIWQNAAVVLWQLTTDVLLMWAAF